MDLGPNVGGFFSIFFNREINFICGIYSGTMLEATRELMRANPRKWSA